jgi:DNA-binding MarR family transcriptional regulator
MAQQGLTDRPDRTPGLLLASTRLTRLLQVHFSRLDEPLSLRQYRLLIRVWQGHTSPSSIGRMMSLSAPTISECADSLVRRGLMIRNSSEQDRRRAVLEITERGIKAIEAAMTTAIQLTDRIDEQLPVDLRRQLDEIHEAIEGNTAGGGHIVMAGNPTRLSGEFYDAFHLELRYQADDHSVTIRVTIRQDRIPQIQATLEEAHHTTETGKNGTGEHPQEPEPQPPAPRQRPLHSYSKRPPERCQSLR